MDFFAVPVVTAEVFQFMATTGFKLPVAGADLGCAGPLSQLPVVESTGIMSWTE